jgi:hypothetical protein
VARDVAGSSRAVARSTERWEDDISDYIIRVKDDYIKKSCQNNYIKKSCQADYIIRDDMLFFLVADRPLKNAAEPQGDLANPININ